MKFFTTTILIVCFTAGLYQDAVAGSCYATTDCVKEDGLQKTETRRVDPFDSVDIKGSFNVTIIRGRHYSLELACDVNFLPYISTDVQNKKLIIFPKKSICATKEIKIVIFAPDVRKINASGSSHISMNDIDSQSLSVSLDGAGDITLSGDAKSLEARLSGANGLDAKTLKTEKTSISIAGSSDASVYASEALEVNISGVGGLLYYGNPKTVSKDISGIGEIKAAK